jgi:hypothetical protein
MARRTSGSGTPKYPFRCEGLSAKIAGKPDENQMIFFLPGRYRSERAIAVSC